jgi:hypothetical protein
MHASAGLAAVLGLVTLTAHGAPQGQVPGTLRSALQHYGLDAAAHAADAPKLDTPLTSSEFAFSGGTFVAAYYFRDELQGQSLGRLRVSVFEKTTGRWRHAPPARQPVGSVLSVGLSDKYIVIEGHANPSAGIGLLLNRVTLRSIARVSGYGLRLLRDETVLYHANMVHFAPLHQERLIVFDPRSRREVEVFPGPRESTIAAAYRNRIRTVYESLSAAQKATFEQSAYGPVGDFDRSISYLAERPAGDRMAFVASYESNRLDRKIPRADVLVQCDRSAVLKWSCTERELEDAARVYSFELRRKPNGWFEAADIQPLIGKVLAR